MLTIFYHKTGGIGESSTEKWVLIDFDNLLLLKLILPTEELLARLLACK